ncbi:MAG: hypothetical protein NC489_22265 [Ruminococcus flavefaciens]|nr:hypothetical protein [Ruminococcus flavefaciens]
MNYLCRAGAYLNSVTATVNSLCGMAMSDGVNTEMQYKAMITLLELEQATAEFIDYAGLDIELPNAVRISRCKFIRINERLIKHLEKIQLQGYHFEELIHTLKLENDTLKEEVSFL